MSRQGDIAVNDLARALESYVMNGRDGDALDLAMFIDSLVTTRIAETAGLSSFAKIQGLTDEQRTQMDGTADSAGGVHE